MAARPCFATGRLQRLPRGFSLIEIAVVLVVLALLLGILASFSGGLVAQQRREVTRQRLQGIEAALALYVSQNKRLPCPADGRLASTNASAGVENITSNACSNYQAHGVVPWRALGLGEQDVTDGWGNRFTYRVAPSMVQTGAMNFTNCDAAGTSSNSVPASPSATTGYCNSTGGSPFAAANWMSPTTATLYKGLTVKNTSQVTVMEPISSSMSTGAAYVVISHGENAVGAYNNQGVLQTAIGVSAGTQEAFNAANYSIGLIVSNAVSCTGAPSPCTTYLVDDFPNFTKGTGYFDDIVLRPSILAVAIKAQTGPRAH